MIPLTPFFEPSLPAFGLGPDSSLPHDSIAAHLYQGSEPSS